MVKVAFTLLALLPIVLALPSPVRRQSEVDCGGDEYTQDEIAAAANAAYNYLSEGTTAGGSKFVIVLQLVSRITLTETGILSITKTTKVSPSTGFPVRTMSSLCCLMEKSMTAVSLVRTEW